MHIYIYIYIYIRFVDKSKKSPEKITKFRKEFPRYVSSTVYRTTKIIPY